MNRFKTVTVEQFALETAKIVGEARKRPIVVRAPGKAAVVLRPLLDDDAAVRSHGIIGRSFATRSQNR